MTGNFTPQRMGVAVSEHAELPTGNAKATASGRLHSVPRSTPKLMKAPVIGVVSLLFAAMVATAFALAIVYDRPFLLFGDRPMLDLILAVLIGGAIAAFSVWLVMRRAVRQARESGEGLRRRLMSVERNQALWVSLSAVLHDVRNPLHNVNLLMESLGTPGIDFEETRQSILGELARIQVRMRRVSHQVSDFLEVEREPVALKGVLTEVAQMINPLAKQSGATFVYHCTPEIKVLADAKFLVQAVDHLLLNSLQILTEQSPDRARRLSVSTAVDGGAVTLAIADTGPGLPEAVRNNPFEPMSTRGTGMGIGLTIAHALTRAAGGELMIARTDASGTQFHLRLISA